ncbi:mycofactocin biosynthesis peptidyl-dipeptidase MftE [uncultured Nocardioides sp.]|uniref:mycofactocin biosynthesis peptidyl-dipeptidase MftE n=1 Tax=uncultured Nocardioides sp. TaxID=198441 RepID=UPI002638ABA2|nr:mycofactocin biosynthesis peptidyl-dipeptidase MftE [uncultured Nocardioides sp.]
MSAPGGPPRHVHHALAQRRWPLLDDDRGTLLLVPVGSTEQHGPHLPLGTDTMVAAAVARLAAERLVAEGRAVAVAPTLSYGASGEHEDFPGTVSIGHEALYLLLVELGRSACRWAQGVVFVNGHGGNVPTLKRAVALLRHEGRPVAWTGCGVPGGDAHAGRTETSILRHLAPWSVQPGLAEPGVTTPARELMAELVARGVRAVSPNGVLGDPTGATAEEGRGIVESLVRRVVGELVDIDVDEDGRLRPGTSRARATESAP